MVTAKHSAGRDHRFMIASDIGSGDRLAPYHFAIRMNHFLLIRSQGFLILGKWIKIDAVVRIDKVFIYH